MLNGSGDLQCEWQECEEKPDFVVETKWGDALFCDTHTKEIERDGDGERVSEFVYEEWVS